MNKDVRKMIENQLRSNQNIYEIAKFWKINFKDLKEMIMNDTVLSAIYFSHKNRINSKKPKQEHVQCFNSPLDLNGCINLASCVMRKAISDGDVRFFESDDYLFYQQFLSNSLDKSDYIKSIIC